MKDGTNRSSRILYLVGNIVMGKNIGNSAGNPPAETGQQTDPTTFRFRVVEYLSWDVYDEKNKRFFPGESINQPFSKMNLKIKEKEGAEVNITTDENGEFELQDQKTTAKFEVTLVPESAELNNKYHVYYNKCAPVQKKL